MRAERVGYRSTSRWTASKRTLVEVELTGASGRCRLPNWKRR